MSYTASDQGHNILVDSTSMSQKCCGQLLIQVHTRFTWNYPGIHFEDVLEVGTASCHRTYYKTSDNDVGTSFVLSIYSNMSRDRRLGEPRGLSSNLKSLYEFRSSRLASKTYHFGSFCRNHKTGIEIQSLPEEVSPAPKQIREHGIGDRDPKWLPCAYIPAVRTTDLVA